MYLPSRDGVGVFDKLRAAVRGWLQSIQSAPPWATVVGLLVAIAFFVVICFQVYRVFSVKENPGGDTPAAAVNPPSRPESGPPTGRRDPAMPAIGGNQRVATPGGNTPTPPPAGPKPELARPEPKDDTAAPPAPDSDAALPPVTGQFEKGVYYIKIQHFMRSRRDAAIAAQAFLKQQGLSCSLVDTKADLVLYLDEPFQIGAKDAKLKKAEQKRADDAKKQIRDLGKKYAKAGGGYAFDQCVEKPY